VLIVAGDARSADAFHNTLDHEAHRLFEVSCLKDALAIVAREPIDVVVADTALPDGTGLALLHEVRRIQPDTMRVLLTSPAGMGTAVGRNGARGCLPLPGEAVGWRRAPRRDPRRGGTAPAGARELAAARSVKGEIRQAIASAYPELHLVRDATGSILLDDTEERSAVALAAG
jgi:ActR/RegA family two-component response regulator